MKARPLLRLVTAATLIVLGGAACDRPAAPDGRATPAVVETVTVPAPPDAGLPATWRRCDNPTRGTSMGYPGDWFTTSLGSDDLCSMFHPTSFVLPANAGRPLVAMNAFQLDMTASEYRDQMTDPTDETVLLNEPVSVPGSLAIRFETSSLGHGLLEAGTHRYGYIFEHSSRAFIIYTVAGPSESRYNDWKSVIDIAHDTVRFT